MISELSVDEINLVFGGLETGGNCVEITCKCPPCALNYVKAFIQTGLVGAGGVVALLQAGILTGVAGPIIIGFIVAGSIGLAAEYGTH